MSRKLVRPPSAVLRLFVPLLLVTGCSLGSEPDVVREIDAPIQTGRLAYVGEPQGGGFYAFALVARFTNATADTVFLARPLALRSEEVPAHPAFRTVTVEGHGAAYTDGGVGFDLAPPLAVAPGESRVDSLRLSGPPWRDPATGEPDVPFWGRMRLRYAAGSCPAIEGCRLPYPVAESNAFVVRAE